MSTPVKSGIDAIVTQNGKVVGYATEVTLDEDFQLESIITLGFHGARGFKSMGYDGSITVGTFILNPELDDGTPVTDNLEVEQRRTILQNNEYTFELIDLKTQQVMLKALGCVNSNNNWSISAGALASKNTTWKCREIVPVKVK